MDFNTNEKIQIKNIDRIKMFNGPFKQQPHGILVQFKESFEQSGKQTYFVNYIFVIFVFHFLHGKHLQLACVDQQLN